MTTRAPCWVDELSFSLGKDKAKVEELINSRLEVGVK